MTEGLEDLEDQAQVCPTCERYFVGIDLLVAHWDREHWSDTLFDLAAL